MQRSLEQRKLLQAPFWLAGLSRKTKPLGHFGLGSNADAVAVSHAASATATSTHPSSGSLTEAGAHSKA